MEIHIILSILAAVFKVFAALQIYQLMKRFKKLKIGDPLSTEFAAEGSKRINTFILLLGVGAILGIIAIFLRPY
ncbi:MAG: hypothetical protein ACK4M9_01740 [Anaerobacillus sp.]|uniref:hypothetical protein n=1 Tax=Anaerobacillus sp. TaxID=1872506 RepID=UPI00391BAD29